MKENFTSINVIIDASGSMQHLAADTIGSFNTFLKEQKEGPGEAAFTLCTFNTDYRLQHDFVKIAGVPNLDSKAYAPSGGTSLLDAMGATINSVGAKLSAMPEEERPSKVIFLIITDGHENSSKTFKGAEGAAKIKQMVTHQKDVYSWEFVFMGANIDAITAGESIGVTASNSINYAATKGGTHKLYDSVSRSMTSYRASAASRNDNFFAGNLDNNPKVDIIPVVPVTPPANNNGSK